uniref:RxLR effector candidate protein n=1 Tax=Hyaloperonospora arabidopsidis (strain Emoy2) TaxID=559515 RepID=M4BTL2_HYAAE
MAQFETCKKRFQALFSLLFLLVVDGRDTVAFGGISRETSSSEELEEDAYSSPSRNDAMKKVSSELEL